MLDFYVHESMQRAGIGKQLFDHMLQVENITPEKLAYDRPSHKLLSFLTKYFDLKHFVPQANNFVVFKKFFQNTYGGISFHNGKWILISFPDPGTSRRSTSLPAQTSKSPPKPGYATSPERSRKGKIS